MSMGMQSKGMGVDAYDNAKEKFVGIWIDNMGTGIAFAEGDYDPTTNSITYELSMMNPMSKQMGNYKQITKTQDKDNKTMEIYSGSGDNSFKIMEMKYTRITE